MQAGIHLILDLEECECEKVLEKVDELKIVMDSLVKEMKFKVVGKCFHQFEPYGATALYLLSESHFSVHTFYMEKKIKMDIYCCVPFDVEEACRQSINLFQGKIASKHVFYR
jgi:S-adenosylmethionine decarboxylase